VAACARYGLSFHCQEQIAHSMFLSEVSRLTSKVWPFRHLVALAGAGRPR
jgi:hypothetical protein